MKKKPQLGAVSLGVPQTAGFSLGALDDLGYVDVAQMDVLGSNLAGLNDFSASTIVTLPARPITQLKFLAEPRK
jgi:hypothetical protein